MLRNSALHAVILLACGPLVLFGGPNEMDRFVWQVLVEICRAPTVGVLSSNTPVAWRLWSTQFEVYPGMSSNPPVSAGIFRVFRPLDCKTPVQQDLPQLREPKSTIDGKPPCEVVWLNRPAATYVLTNGLYNRSKLALMATGGRVHLPAGTSNPSRELKTEWRRISPSQYGRYIAAVDVAGRLYGLVALHLMTHEAPDWIWATWIHRDYSGYVPQQFMRDSFGVESGGVISIGLKQLLVSNNERFLANYALIGSQTGPLAPKYLSNPMIEGPGFQSYSCMGCHAYSAITNRGDWGGPPASSAVGVVHVPTEFHRLDFDFSLASQSKCGSGTASVPTGCDDLILADQ